MATHLTRLFTQADDKRRVALIHWQIANVSILPQSKVSFGQTTIGAPEKFEVTVVGSILDNLTQEIIPGRMAFLEVTKKQLENLLIADNIVDQVHQQSPVFFNAPEPMPRLRPIVGKVKWYPQDQIAVVIVKKMGDMTEQLRTDAPGTLAASLFDPPVTGTTRVFANVQDIGGMEERRRNPDEDLRNLEQQMQLSGSLEDKLNYAQALIRMGQIAKLTADVDYNQMLVQWAQGGDKYAILVLAGLEFPTCERCESDLTDKMVYQAWGMNICVECLQRRDMPDWDDDSVNDREDFHSDLRRKNPDEDLQNLEQQMQLSGFLEDKLKYAQALVRSGQDLNLTDSWVQDRKFISEIWGDLPLKYHGIDVLELLWYLDERFGPNPDKYFERTILGRYIGNESTSQEVYLGYIPSGSYAMIAGMPRNVGDQFVIGWDIRDRVRGEDEIEYHGLVGGWLLVKVGMRRTDLKIEVSVYAGGIGSGKGFYPRTLKEIKKQFPKILDLRLD